MRLEARRARRQIAHLTPLIDVVFILLLFFLLAFNVSAWRAIDVSIPSGQSAESRPADTARALLVSIRPDGRLDVGGQMADIGSLHDHVAPRLAVDPELQVLVRPHRDAPVQDVVWVMDELAQSGVASVALTRPRPGS